jgi:hypothetical protein
MKAFSIGIYVGNYAFISLGMYRFDSSSTNMCSNPEKIL